MAGKFQKVDFDLKKLPAIPVVAAQMIELSNSHTASASQLADLVSKDPVISARVLRIANSSYYSMSRQVKTLSTAIVVLGEQTLKSIVLAAGMRSIHQPFDHFKQMLWADSMVCALGSRFLAQKLSLTDPEEAFMAGLFRHIGKVVINNQDGSDKAFIEQMIIAEDQDLAERERQKYGTTHSEIGAAVLEHWQLSEMMSLVALNHFSADLTDIADQNTNNMICLVNIASEFPAMFGIFGQPNDVALVELAGSRELNLEEEKLAEILQEFSLVFEENREDFLS